MKQTKTNERKAGNEMEKQNTITYQGQIIDRHNDNILSRTRYYNTWEAAQHAADKLAKRSGYGDRCKIVIIDK